MSLGKASMSLLDFPRNAAKGSSCKETVVRVEEMEPFKAMESSCDLVGEG